MRYILQRLLSSFFTLFAVVTATFFLMKAVPGDPFMQEKAIPEEILQSLRAHYKLNAPIWEQYVHYLKSVVTWNLGPSFKYPGRSVNEIIAQGFPVSAALGAWSMALALTGGIFLGSMGACFPKKWPDSLAMLLSFFGLSLPSFLLAALLQYLLAMKLHLLPVARWGTFSQAIMPCLALGALPAAYITRLVRLSLRDVLQQDYIQAALAKGLPFFSIYCKHALKNALLPLLGYFGPLLANILTGSFVVEQIFGIPGLGSWFVTSVANRDYTLIMGLTVFYSALLLLSVLCMDLLYAWLDPRIRFEV